MKFLLMNGLTGLGLLLLVHTLPEPLMTVAVRTPLTLVVVLLAMVTAMMERRMRPSEGATPGSQVRRVMGVTMVKMFVMLGIILAYLVAGLPDPKVFGVSSYLAYLAFSSILVAESMRH